MNTALTRKPPLIDTVAMAKSLMKRFEVVPVSPEVKVGTINEVFQHPMFLNASAERRREIMLQSAQAKYENELDYSVDNYFGIERLPWLRGKRVLDLGCFTGGRSVAWFERFGLAHISGVDVAPEYIEAATLFAESKGVPSDFRVAGGEALPFDDEAFDAIVSFDVFEHVQSVADTLKESYRVLKPGGRLYVVFPSYFQPTCHHLGLVTNMPFIHYLFSGETLVKAYSDILDERGSAASWYKRHSSRLESWERSNIINGTTLRKFRRLMARQDWNVVMQNKQPIGTVGRRAARSKWRLPAQAFRPLTNVPIVQEMFLHRISFILERPTRPGR